VKTIINVVNGEASPEVAYSWTRITRYTISDTDEVIKNELAIFEINLAEGTIDLRWREFKTSDLFFDLESPSTFLLHRQP